MHKIIKDTTIAILFGLILIGYYGCGKDDKETANEKPSTEETPAIKLPLAKGAHSPTPDSIKLE